MRLDYQEGESSPRRYYDSEAEALAIWSEETLDILPTESVENHCITLWSNVIATSSQWNAGHTLPSEFPVSLYSLLDLKDTLTQLWWHFLVVGMSTDSALDHQRLGHFLSCVKQIGYLPPKGTPPLPETEGQQGRLWTDMPFFEPTLVDLLGATFRGQRGKVPYRVPQHGLQEWRNLNMLAARLSVSQVHDARLYAVFAMRDVLEEEIVVAAIMIEVVDMWLATCGYWLEEMAAYALVVRRYGWEAPLDVAPGLVHHKTTVAIAPGRLAEEAGIDSDDVSPARWHFWRSRLQSLAADNTAFSSRLVSALGRMAVI